MSGRDMPGPMPDLDSRDWESDDEPAYGRSEPRTARTIGRFVAVNPPEPKVSRHSRAEYEPGDEYPPAVETSGGMPAVETSGRIPALDTGGDIPAPETHGRIPALETSGRTRVVETSGRIPEVETSGRIPAVETSDRQRAVETSGRTRAVETSGRTRAVETSERTRAVDIHEPAYRAADREIATFDPVTHRVTISRPVRAKRGGQHGLSSLGLGAQGDQGKGFVVVLALVGASIGVTGALVWGLHLLPHSAPSTPVASLDTSRGIIVNHPPRPARSGLGSTADRDPDAALEGGLDDPDDLGRSSSSTDDPLSADRADEGSSSLSVPSDSADTTGSDSKLASRSGGSADGLDSGSLYGSQSSGRANSSTSTPGSQSRPQPRGGAYPDSPSYPDGDSGYSRGPDRPRRGLPGVGQDSMPGLGGL